MDSVIHWINHNWWNVLQTIGNILLIEKVVKDAAVKRGYTKLVSICDKIADLLNFFLEIVGGVFNAIKSRGGNNVQAMPNTTVRSPAVSNDTSKG